MITLKNINLNFLNQTIFENFSQTFALDDKVGLVGPNGAGKSTLLKIIAGLQKPDSGSIILGKNRIAYLPQELVLNSNKNVLDEAFTAFDSGKIIDEQKIVESELEKDPNNKELTNKLLDLSNQLADYNITQDLETTKNVLIGLGFDNIKFHQGVNELSVGWKMRLILAKLLLQKADFYLFDEPTNHLDITTKEWFFNFLKESNSGFILISHERYFLNELCDKTLALESGTSKMYYGNYDFFEKEKKSNFEKLKNAKMLQDREIEKKQETINKFRASATKAKMAQSMMKELDKIERIELPPEPRIIKLPFGEIKKSNKQVLRVSNLTFGYEKNKPLFKNVNFEIERGQKVAIVAPNGKGKTTLFKLLTGELKPDSGKIEFDEKTTTAIFEQDEYSSLNQNKTIIEEVSNSVNSSYEKIRSFLGAFLFDNESIEKKIKVLSGGEKNRVKLIKALLKSTNLLLLDEPTNHLDIPSKDVLVEALVDFPGTILFVSHDRDFINKVATHIINLKENDTYMYSGNYDDFLSQCADAKEFTTNEPRQENKNQNQGKKEINLIEREINKIEQRIKKINEQFVELEYGSQEFEKNLKNLKDAEKELENLILEWEDKVN